MVLLISVSAQTSRNELIRARRSILTRRDSVAWRVRLRAHPQSLVSQARFPALAANRMNPFAPSAFHPADYSRMVVMFPRSRLIDVWDQMRNSYWFVPSVMFFGALVLAFVMVRLDLYLWRSETLTDSPLFPKFEGDASRSILSTIASGMVTVTGVVFSLTIVSLQLASSQFGPRLLRAFMSSLGNQIVLGTFTSTFLYCLIVIGTVRGSMGFVPQLSTVTGILLGVIDIAVLIFLAQFDLAVGGGAA